MSIPTQLNNPGDLRPTDPSQPTLSNSSGEFRQFDSPEKGFEALLNDVQSKISGNTSTGLGPKSTLADFASVYAPESDNNNSGQYAVNLANQMKVRPDTTLGELQPRIGEFAKAIANNEGYQWADQPAETTPQASSGNFFEDNAKPIADWMFTHVVPFEAAAAGGLAAFGPSLATLGGVGGTAATTASGGGVLGKIGNFFTGTVPKAAEGYAASELVHSITGGGQQPNQPITQSPQDNSQNTLQSLLSEMQPQVNASKGIIGGYQDVLSRTQGGRVNLQDPNFREGLTNSAVNGRLPDVDQNGNMDFSHAEKERAKEASAAAKLEESVVGDGKFKTSEAAKLAEKYIPQSATPHERAQAIRHIKSEAASYGGLIPLNSGVQARHQQYASAKGKYGTAMKTSAQIMAHKALGAGFRDAVRNHTEHKDLYDKLLKHQQNLKNEQKLYRMLNGKKAPETNKLSKTLHQFGTRALATYIGDRVGGVLGAVLGNVVLSVGAKAADKHFGKNVFDSPRVRAGLKVLKEDLPKQYDILKAQLEKKGIKVPNMDEKGTSSEEGLIKDLRKGGLTKSEKVLTGALKMSKEQLIRKKNPSALKSKAIKNAKTTPYRGRSTKKRKL